MPCQQGWGIRLMELNFSNVFLTCSIKGLLVILNIQHTVRGLGPSLHTMVDNVYNISLIVQQHRYTGRTFDCPMQPPLTSASSSTCPHPYEIDCSLSFVHYPTTLLDTQTLKPQICSTSQGSSSSTHPASLNISNSWLHHQ